MATGRNHLGRFAPGNPGGPGRPPKQQERHYLDLLSTACGDDDWREIAERAVEDAKKGDHRAREWLSKYLLPNSDNIAIALSEQPEPDVESENCLMDLPPDKLLTLMSILRECGAMPGQTRLLASK